MAKNKQNFDERYTDEADEVVVEVKGGTHTADLIERLERDERFSKITTLEDNKKFVNKLMNRMAESLGRGGFGMGIPGMGANNPMFQTPTIGIGGMNPATNSLFGAGAMVKMMSGENPNTLDKLMIMKTMVEHLEKESVGVELECAHDVSNSIYDAISKISLSKKSDIRAKNKEEKK